MWQSVCEKWSVTDGVWQRCVWVCEKRCSTKLCVKVGMWQSVCERWSVTKMCVRELLTKIVWQMVCEQSLCERWCVTDSAWQIYSVWQRCVWDGLWNQGGSQCHEYHACHAKWRWMWDGATPATWNERRCHQVPATQSAAATRATKTVPSPPPCAMSATPATQNQGECEKMPRLPRETTVDVIKCHACHAKCRGVIRN